MNSKKKIILFVRCSTSTQDISSQLADLRTFARSLNYTDLNNNILEFSKRVLNTEKILFKPATDGIGKDNAFEYCYMLGKKNMVKKIMENKKGGK